MKETAEMKLQSNYTKLHLVYIMHVRIPAYSHCEGVWLANWSWHHGAVSMFACYVTAWTLSLPHCHNLCYLALFLVKIYIYLAIMHLSIYNDWQKMNWPAQSACYVHAIDRVRTMQLVYDELRTCSFLAHGSHRLGDFSIVLL